MRRGLLTPILTLACSSCILLVLATCRRRSIDIARPALDPTLCAAPDTPPSFDFQHANLVTHFEGIEICGIPDELRAELNVWTAEHWRDERRDSSPYLPNGFPN